MLKVIIIMLIILVVVAIIYLLYKYKHPRLEYINITSGAVGTGKSSFNLCHLVWLLRRFYFLGKNRKIKKDYIVLSNVPLGKYDNKHNYRYLKIYHKRIKCYDLSVDTLLMLEKLPQDEVIIYIQEFDNFVRSTDWKVPVVRDNMKEFFKLFRHYTRGKGYIFLDCQRASSLPIDVRACSGYTYNMISCKKIPFIPICFYEYEKIILSEDVSNEVSLNDSTDESYIRKFVFFTNPFKNYNSYVYRERYDSVSKILELSVSDITYRLDIFKNPYAIPKYYEPLQYDFKPTIYLTSESQYYAYCKQISKL